MAKAKDKLLAEWFWTDRWMGSSGFLLPMEPRGLYREMLTQAWRRGARLPNDHAAIRVATGTSLAEWRRCWPKVEKFWRVDGDSLVNDTQLEVYAEAKSQAAERQGRAKAGAEARWAQRKQGPSNAQASAQAKPERCPPSPSPSPNEHGGSGSSSSPPPHPATANPLVDRPALEAEGAKLLGLISEREDLDPTEVLSTASGWKGKGGFVRFETLYDDRLARTLIALRSWWRRLNGEPEPGPPAALALRDQAPPLSPLTEHNLRALGLKGGE
jgi:uncharacterized protein YdaU (DUF1376 family)